MATKSTLVRKRDFIKSQLSRFESFLSFVAEDEIDFKLLAARLEQAKPLLDQFNKVQFDLEGCSGINKEEENVIWENFESAYMLAVSRANGLLEKPASSVEPRISQQVQYAQMPNLNIPKFKGVLENWLNFRDTFVSLVHDNRAIPVIQKFHYLQGSLEGKASDVISSLRLSDANYHVAWNSLLERYDNEQMIADEHVQGIFDLPSLTKENPVIMRQIYDGLSKHLRALKYAGQPVENWDLLIIYIIANKFDPNTRLKWASFKPKRAYPIISHLTDFLKESCEILESARLAAQRTGYKGTKSNSCVSVDEQHSSQANLRRPCSFCDNSEHLIYDCESFKKLAVKDRIDAAKTKKLCLNCLRRGHFSPNCRARRCAKCGKRHNILLHLEIISPAQPSATNNVEETQQQSSRSLSNHVMNVGNQVLLSTAIVQIQDQVGNYRECRALLDSGSQSNFITDELFTSLGLNKIKIDHSIIGVSQIATKINFKTNAIIKSKLENYSTSLSFLIIPQITGNIPGDSFDSSHLEIPPNIRLADHDFNISSQIDLLLGATVFWDLISIGRINIPNSSVILQKTRFGWVFGGPLNSLSSPRHSQCNISINENETLQNQLAKFWEVEECSNFASLSISTDDETLCEKHFLSTTMREKDGRFVVSIPFKDDLNTLGNSLETATKRFNQMERKFARDPNLKTLYCNFMKEYEMLGHMSLIKADHSSAFNNYYLPHHAVVKSGKIRVVFDGSSPTSSGISLNDIQRGGPVIQDDLFSILLRFRQHPFVLTADITKMYRQVLIQPAQRDFQRILWRNSPGEPLQHFTLNTVTYGTASASFLAIRCLHQLGHSNLAEFPRTSRIILKDFYVDDLLTGANTPEELMTIRDEICQILEKGGFELRKWVSNEPKIQNSTDSANACLHIVNKKENIKILGLLWDPNNDLFSYHIDTSKIKQGSVTKRSILSTIAQIFDPLGLLAPIIIRPKIIIQKLWQEKVTWDESVPPNIHTAWLQFINDLESLSHIKFPRYVSCKNYSQIELHGFSDSSESAYGACVYIRTIDANNKINVNILCAKSRVTPIKRISIPRLELSGALLLARLMKAVSSSLNINFDTLAYWCDSTIVLPWIKTPPNLLKVFVGNRVSEIQNLTDSNSWGHIRSLENPADLITRGTSPKMLSRSLLWSKGPHWLSFQKSNWPAPLNCANQSQVEDELKPQPLVSAVSIGKTTIFEKYSSATKLQRVIAYCIRFKSNALKPAPDRNYGVYQFRS